MLDLATASLSLRTPRHNALKNMIFPKNRRSFFAGLALIALAGGWHAIHHVAPAAMGQVAIPSVAIPGGAQAVRTPEVEIQSGRSGRPDARNAKGILAGRNGRA
jgi:hypothetical protein